MRGWVQSCGQLTEARGGGHQPDTTAGCRGCGRSGVGLWRDSHNPAWSTNDAGAPGSHRRRASRNPSFHIVPADAGPLGSPGRRTTTRRAIASSPGGCWTHPPRRSHLGSRRARLVRVRKRSRVPGPLRPEIALASTRGRRGEWPHAVVARVPTRFCFETGLRARPGSTPRLPRGTARQPERSTATDLRMIRERPAVHRCRAKQRY